MFGALVGLIVIFILAAGALWLAWRMRRRQHAIAKWGGMIGLGFFGVLFSLVTVLASLGMVTVFAPRGNDVVQANVAGTPEQIARGSVIAVSLCAGCHSMDHELPLTGNTNLLEDIPMPLGNAWPPNLTPAGRIDDWTDGELIRAIREGTYPNGHRMPIMSSQTFREFSQDDLDSIVAYLRSEPAATDDDLGEPKQGLSTLAMVMATLGMLPLKDLPESNVPPPAVAIGPTAEYGAYIVGFSDCAICHGDTFEGGAGGILPKGPTLLGVKGWQSAEFVTAMRTGVTPAGNQLDPDEMPWEGFGKMDDVMLQAIYEFLKTL